MEENNWGEIDGIEMVHTSPKDESQEKKKKWERVLGENGKRIGENRFYSLSILKVKENHWGEINGIEMVHTSPKDESREREESEREYLWGNGKKNGENRFYSLEYFKSGRK